jgi:hypothetical protein
MELEPYSDEEKEKSANMRRSKVRYFPLLTVTYRYLPLLTVTYRYLPLLPATP